LVNPKKWSINLSIKELKVIKVKYSAKINRWHSSMNTTAHTG